MLCIPSNKVLQIGNLCVEMYADHLKFAAPTWKRPDGPPRVWRVFDGRRKLENGEIPRFSIQEVPKEFADELVDYMEQNFLREEILCNYLGIADDPLALREFRSLWRELIGHGITVVAFVVNSDPLAKPVIAGTNILHVITAEDEANTDDVTKFQSKSMKKIMLVMGKWAREGDILRKYGVDKYLSAFGLSVHPRFRGQGLGEELLRVRDSIGPAYQIHATETIFSAKAAQVAASHCNFDVLIEKKFTELFDEDGNAAFSGLTTETMQVTAKRI